MELSEWWNPAIVIFFGALIVASGGLWAHFAQRAQAYRDSGGDSFCYLAHQDIPGGIEFFVKHAGGDTIFDVSLRGLDRRIPQFGTVNGNSDGMHAFEIYHAAAKSGVPGHYRISLPAKHGVTVQEIWTHPNGDAWLIAYRATFERKGRVQERTYSDPGFPRTSGRLPWEKAP